MIIKLLSFNIQHCKNYVSKEIDIKEVINLIKETGADIIGLNEVYGEYENNPPQYMEIANALGYYYYFGMTFVYKNIPFGNALISKYKLKNPSTIMIPDPEIRDSHWYETRCIIRSNFEDFDLNVLVTHYGLFPSEQENAYQTTFDILENIDKKIVLMGDFNLEPNSEIIKKIENKLINTLGAEHLTFPSIDPVKKIDYIFVSNDIKYRNAKIINKVVSDHLAHYVEIEID